MRQLIYYVNYHFYFVDEMSTGLGESLGDLGAQLEAITEKMKQEDSRVEDDLVRFYESRHNCALPA